MNEIHPLKDAYSFTKCGIYKGEHDFSNLNCFDIRIKVYYF